VPTTPGVTNCESLAAGISASSINSDDSNEAAGTLPTAFCRFWPTIMKHPFSVVGHIRGVRKESERCRTIYEKLVTPPWSTSSHQPLDGGSRTNSGHDEGRGAPNEKHIMNKQWFEVNKAGLSKQAEQHSKGRLIGELIQNGLDEEGVTQIAVSLALVPKEPRKNKLSKFCLTF
jgi:hypothetical protein